MSVLIKNMEMPKNCLECEWHEYYGGDYDWCHACRKTGTMPIENAETHRADDCPLVEVHGRLVEFIDVTTYEDDDSGTEEVNLGEVFAAYFKMREATLAEGE